MMLAVTVDIDFHPFAQGVDDADAHAVQTAGDGVAVGVEFAAGVQGRQHDFQSTGTGLLVLLDGNAAAVVLDGATAVGLNPNDDFRAVSGQGLVDGVVQHFVDEMMQTADAAVADVHVRTLAHRVHAAQHLDIAGIILIVLRAVLSVNFRHGFHLP